MGYVDVIALGIAGFDDDEHSSSARVTVRLLDVNDNRPVFGRHPDSVSVAEDAPPGYVVFSVPATDEDPGANGLLRYSIHPSGDPHGYFTVDGTGSVRVGRSLDREAVHLYLLRIEAKDNGHPSLSARTTVILGRLVSESACEQEDPGSNPAADMVDAARNTAWDLGPTMADRLGWRNQTNWDGCTGNHVDNWLLKWTHNDLYLGLMEAGRDLDPICQLYFSRVSRWACGKARSGLNAGGAWERSTRRVKRNILFYSPA
ncbi:Cadherin [Trinorchestia longiramus]|nr:Cadherin [Trinorchestia longiramus]